LPLLLALTACPKSPKRTRVIPDVPTSGDPAARAKFQQARARFERDGEGMSAREFESIAREYPDDPIAPYARFYSGRASFRDGSYEDARATLAAIGTEADVDDALRRRVRLFLGLATGYLGDHARAIALLDDAEAANDDNERGERFAVLAQAHAATGAAARAFPYYDAWYPIATGAEKAYLVARTRELASTLDWPAAAKALEALPNADGPSTLALAERIASSLGADATANGDASTATRMRQIATRARGKLGLDAGGSRGDGNSQLVGAVLPLSGKRGRIGSAALTGAALAAGTFDRTSGQGVGADGMPKPFTLSTRDSKSLADVAGDAVSRLRADGAVAIVGPLDTASVRVAARQAADDGVPLIALDQLGGEDVGVDSPYVFHIALSPEVRARALARHAYDAGKRRFAILHPEGNYGEQTAAAFRSEVESLGGSVISVASYDRKTTSFTKVIGTIRGKPWDALFVPDAASRLELVVPALASANLMVLPAKARDPKRGRKILLLSTAEALRPKYLRGSGRYSEGAVFAPGFYADEDDPVIGPYVSRYQAAYDKAPTYLDAYAFDAALVVRAAVESGARSRAEVSASLAASSVDGLTGAIRFSAAHRRADAGLLFVVDKDAGGEYRIHARR
jgi:ABC-type branched-subunit amino acid transport system substrate-binding protein